MQSLQEPGDYSWLVIIINIIHMKYTFSRTKSRGKWQHKPPKVLDMGQSLPTEETYHRQYGI
jgi:hypothetical protein